MAGARVANDSNASLRARQASPRSSSTKPARGSFSESEDSDEAHSDDSSEGQSPTRGRSMNRIPAQRTKSRRATIIRRDRQRSVVWDYNSDSTPQQQQQQQRYRLTSRDLTAEPQCMFDSIKEPLPIGVERYRSSLSEELYKAATWDTDVDPGRFGNHRDTFAIFGVCRSSSFQRLELPDAVFERLLRYVGFETYLAIRLSCRCWLDAITRVRPVVTPPVCCLPAEILEKIYFRLGPVDFDSARHTCRAWMITSLEEKLLTIMLGRGGWLKAAEADVKLQTWVEGEEASGNVNREWLLSKRLATECSLRPDWKGNGLPIGTPPPLSLPEGPASRNLSLTATTDFSELSNAYSPVGDCKHGSAVQSTVSVCKRFLLVAEGCLVYVYSILNDKLGAHRNQGYLSCLTTVVCPYRVLAVSMDTSSNRFAIAALLEGRVGFVCDVSSTTGLKKHSAPRALSTAIRSGRGDAFDSGEHFMEEVTLYGSSNGRLTARAIVEGSLPEIHGARNTRQLWTMDDPLLSPIQASGSSQDYETPHGHISLADGARSVYRNLCSFEDPPRTVAICPQRRCVAFGCAAGIELHWIDALTGQDLNRWFPLTAPSDYLYFLPPRPGVDSAKKLRLISSAAHSREVSGLQRKFFPRDSSDASRYHSMTWDEEFQGVGPSGSAWRGSGWCDHYHAVPVSDGWNILFTDPEEGVLCLGSDAPPGAHATRLSKRFCFAGPVDVVGKSIVPGVYASSQELRWGVRVVVGYAEALWLFAVPPDVFFAADSDVVQDEQEPREAKTHTPIPIQGVEIDKVHGLIDVAVDASGGDVMVWAFTAGGMAYVWQIGRDNEPWQEWVVERDGTIIPLRDADGDSFMHNMPSPAVHFDGNDPVSMTQGVSYGRIIDTDTDRKLPNVDEDEGYGSEFDAAGGTFAIHAPPLRGRWSEDDADWVPDYLAEYGSEIGDEGLGIDVLEMSRMDVEVLCG